MAIAYNLAVSIDEPLTALVLFFVAVLLVIVGTYLLMISGSVAFCKLLQRNQKYYYQPNHFVSVSSMIYRMKRNGAGLASICILLTMVLVMISSTTALYFGEEDSVRNKCPNNVNIVTTFDSIDGISEANLNMLREEIQTISGEKIKLEGMRTTCRISGLITQNGIIINVDNYEEFSVGDYDQVGNLSVMALEDYNNMMGTDKTLATDECFVFCDRLNYQWDTFTMEYGETYQVKEHLQDFPVDGDAMALVVPTVFLVVDDIYAFTKPVRELKDRTGNPLMTYEWRVGFDVDTEEKERETATALRERFRALYMENKETFYSFSIQSREAQRDAFYDLFGSLFFIGIMLSIVFLMAAVLIIYYKQLSEGYEDHARFEIMQKVGMTKRDIRKSINSQMLTVFFLPLILAGVHLGFAFPFISKILVLFGFDNTLLNIIVNAVCFAVFGVFYALVYKITSNVYYGIVSGRRE